MIEIILVTLLSMQRHLHAFDLEGNCRQFREGSVLQISWRVMKLTVSSDFQSTCARWRSWFYEHSLGHHVSTPRWKINASCFRIISGNTTRQRTSRGGAVWVLFSDIELYTWCILVYIIKCIIKYNAIIIGEFHKSIFRQVSGKHILDLWQWLNRQCALVGM